MYAWLKLLSGLLSLVFAWSWYVSVGHSGMYQIQLGDRAVSILRESGRCEVTVIRPLRLYMHFLDFTRWVQLTLPNQARLSLDTSGLSLWQLAGFEYAKGSVRAKTYGYGGEAEAIIPESFKTQQQIDFHWSPPLSALIIGFPYWFAVLVTSLWPAIAAFSALRRARNHRFEEMVVRGICPRCKYDLRATPMRCPECGWVRLPPKMTREEHS